MQQCFSLLNKQKKTILDFPKGTFKILCYNMITLERLQQIKVILTQQDVYETLNVKMSNSQLNKLKFAIKNRIERTLKISSNLIGNSDDETNFSHKLLLTDTQASKIVTAFANGSSANTKFSKTYLSKMIQSGWILGELLVAIKLASKLAEKAEYYINKGTNELNKKIKSVKAQA